MKNAFGIILRPLVTLISVAIALIIGLALWDYYINAPWTRDGRVLADVVAVAPDVPGLVTEVLVRDNQRVRKGDLLFRIDPDRFDIAIRQAEADVAGKKASYEQAQSDYERYDKLSDNAVSQQRLELAQATAQEAKAAYDQAIADRDLAKLNRNRSEVRASVNGLITNMDLRPGAYVSVGRGVTALLDEDTLRVEGYFEENKLPRIHVGDAATVRLIGERTPLTGRVESIAGGIEDRERTAGTNLLANVNPTFSWVRLAQRIPVRIALDPSPQGIKLVSGRTATVEIKSGQSGPAK
jgi:RND family efflux transporter MFP subunit